MSAVPDRITVVIPGLCISLVGTVLTVFPFATPETVALLGIKRSCRLVRMLGMMITVTGILFAALIP